MASTQTIITTGLPELKVEPPSLMQLSPGPAMSPPGTVSSSLSPSSSSLSPSPGSGGSSTGSGAPLLPPCRVCGEKASGFHYGANTCEACKGFFRRSLARKANYRCAGTETCEIEPGKRSTCAYCRYQKCLAIGMSKDAIKTGRYTHEKKTRDIEEVKRIQNREAVQNKARGLQTQEEREAELEKIIKHITAAHLEQTPHSPEFFQKLPEKEAEYLEKRALQEKMFGPMKPIPREEYQQIYNTTGIDIDGRREMISQIIPGIEKAIKRFINFAKALPGFKELPIEDQIALIKGSRFDHWFLMHFRNFNVEHQLYTFPSTESNETTDIYRWSALSSLTYLQPLFTLAGRIQKLHLLTSEVAILKAIAVFSPGSRVQTWVLTTHRWVNSEKGLLTGNCCGILHINDIKKLNEGVLVDEFFRCCRLFQQLHLQVPEISLLQGIIMLSPENTKLQQPEMAQKYQSNLKDCLRYWFTKVRPDDPTIYDRCLTCLDEMATLRSLSPIWSDTLSEGDGFDVPQLLLEMWAS